MSIRDVIVAVNHMEADGVIERYAIGGAVGATFYVEPVATLDIDLFVTFRAIGESVLLPLQPIYDYLMARGASMKREYVLIAGWPVQFLPPTGPLVEEALLDAVEADVDGVTARVFTPEHLAAIALQTGRAKDKARLLQFIEEGALDGQLFEAIIQRHHLDLPWERFQRQFISDAR
jgi:hypothetical protein